MIKGYELGVSENKIMSNGGMYLLAAALVVEKVYSIRGTCKGLCDSSMT